MSDVLVVAPVPAQDPEIGRWLWAMEELRRRRTLRLVTGLDQRTLDWEGPDWRENAIGSSEGRLTRVLGVPLAEHLGRLERSRAVFLDTFRNMTLEDWRRLRSPSDEQYQATPEWAVFHLVEHEAGHAYQISSLKARAARGGISSGASV